MGKYIYGLFGKDSREFTLASHSAGIFTDHYCHGLVQRNSCSCFSWETSLTDLPLFFAVQDGGCICVHKAESAFLWFNTRT